MKHWYQCSFLLQTSPSPQVLAIPDKPHIPGLERFAAFRDGFWIDENFELCLPDSGKYWIPPGQILFIRRIEVPPEDQEQDK